MQRNQEANRVECNYMLVSACILNKGENGAMCKKQARENGVVATLPLMYPLRGYAPQSGAAGAAVCSIFVD